MKYYLNKNLDYEYGNKVHTEECYWVPALKNRVPLGDHPNAFEAIEFAKTKAKKKYPNANACFWCSREAIIASNDRQKTKTQLENEVEAHKTFIAYLNMALNDHLPSNAKPNLKSIIVQGFKTHISSLYERGHLSDTTLLIYDELFEDLSRSFTEEKTFFTFI